MDSYWDGIPAFIICADKLSLMSRRILIIFPFLGFWGIFEVFTREAVTVLRTTSIQLYTCSSYKYSADTLARYRDRTTSESMLGFYWSIHSVADLPLRVLPTASSWLRSWNFRPWVNFMVLIFTKTPCTCALFCFFAFFFFLCVWCVCCSVQPGPKMVALAPTYTITQRTKLVNARIG